ncbi:MAG: phosphotransferase system HPr-like phosphotransfer protein [Myxococcota bacterium]|jgi:phosphotransferase system HPr-like phosphotransfer protein
MDTRRTNPARTSKLSEDSFAPALERQSAGLFNALAAINIGGEGCYGERLLYALFYEAELLEDYLDSHGASRNKRFHLIREDVSGIKWVSKALSCLALLRDGRNSYPAADQKWNDEQIVEHVRVSTACLTECLSMLASQLNHSWLAADMSVINPKRPSVDIHPPSPLLPPDLINDEDDDINGDANLMAQKYLSRLLRLYGSWDVAATQRLVASSDTKLFMKKYCTEAIARSFQSRVHNLQSDYDSYLRNTAQELSEPSLRKVRGAISQCLHLLEAVTALTHLYERHGHREHLSHAIPWKALVTVIVNHLVLPAYRSIEVCVPLTRELLATLTVRESVEVDLPDGVEMHARPLSMIANVVKHHGLDVEIECDGKRANAASFMAMLVLIGSHPKVTRYTFYGENSVISDIEQLFKLGLGEISLKLVTDTFPYLK